MAKSLYEADFDLRMLSGEHGDESTSLVGERRELTPADLPAVTALGGMADGAVVELTPVDAEAA